MKQQRILLVILALFCLLPVKMLAQELSVTYGTKLNMKSFGLDSIKNLPEASRKSLEESFGSIEMKHNLSYVNGISVLKMIPFKEKQTISIFGIKMDISKMMEEELREVIYKDHSTNQLRIRTIHRGKAYLVLDAIKVDPYIVQTTENRIILGFDCQMAISEDGETKIWFTTKYPISDGPIATCPSVKGLILAVDSKEVKIEAKSIEYKVRQTLVPPTGGKKIDFVQYEKFIED